MAATGYVFYKKNSPGTDSRNSIEVNALKLYDVYSHDPLLAEKRYRNRTVLVKGELYTIIRNVQQQDVVLLKTSMPRSFINCTFKQAVEHIKPMSPVLIRGTCSGQVQPYPDMGITGDVYLTRCSPVKERFACY